MRSRQSVLLPVLVLGATVLGGCSGSDEEPSTTGSATAVAPATPDTSTETSAEAGPTTDGPDGTGSDTAVPEGAGCAPGTDDLPDGRWYGQVVEVGDGTLEFNLMCWFLGEEAVRAAQEDGVDAEEVVNDYYVRDQNPALRTLDVADAAPALHYPTGDPAETEELTVEEWGQALEAGDVYLNVWLTVEDGEVVNLDEQWVP